MALRLTDEPLELREYAQATALHFLYDHEQRTIRGCLYDSSGEIIPLSQRVSGVGGDRVNNIDSPILPAGTIAGTSVDRESVYLGHLMAQYGHFLLESLSTFWAMQQFPGRQVIFHPFIFGGLIQPFMAPFFEAFEIDSSDILVLNAATTFNRIIVPQRTFQLNSSVHRQFGALPRIVARHLLAKRSAFGPAGQHLFLSRAKLPPSTREAANPAEVDQCMAELGFDIIHPQDMPIEEQILLYSSSSIIAGFAGSALHNALFAPTRTVVLEIGDRRSSHRMLPAQELCNMAGDLDGRHIAFRPKAVGQEAEMDIGYLRSQVLRELAAVPAR